MIPFILFVVFLVWLGGRSRRGNFKPSTFNDSVIGIMFPRKFYVYEFIDLGSGVVIYVGKGSKDRFARLRNRDPRLEQLRRQGRLGVRIIHENIASSRQAELIEEVTIKAYINEGYDLLNKIHNPHR